MLMHFVFLSFADERDAIQKKTFTKWVNKHLKKVSPTTKPFEVIIQLTMHTNTNTSLEITQSPSTQTSRQSSDLLHPRGQHLHFDYKNGHKTNSISFKSWTKHFGNSILKSQFALTTLDLKRSYDRLGQVRFRFVYDWGHQYSIIIVEKN